jgi:transcriptional regulator GlxA family with amidase domain
VKAAPAVCPRWLRVTAPKARRTASVCAGAFLLAEAGLLHGRRAATHWSSCTLLGERYPSLKVEPDAIFVRDDPIWTSAGVSAGIDLSLAMVQDDCGHNVAMQHTAAVKSPLPLPLLLNGVLGHALFVGLPIALAARRISNQSSFSTQAAQL